MAGNRIVLDSGALSSLARRNGLTRYSLKKALASGDVVVLPTVVLVEATTGNGPRDAAVNRVVRACLLVELDERIARSAAALRFHEPACGVADSVIVATADAFPGSVVLTGDVRDMKALAAVRGLTAVAGI